MHTRMLRRAGWLAPGLAVFLVAGCWDGGDDTPSPPTASTEIPDSALASPTAYTEFALGLPTSDTTEPLNIDKVSVAPSDETSEPIDFD